MAKSNIKYISIVGSDHVNKSNLDYALYTAQVRAIPSAWDGCKDGGRKALWCLRTKTKEIKTVALSGDMIAKELYLHGDAAASDSISEMAAFYKNTVPFIEGIGNFGCRKTPSDFGSPRYTYVKANQNTEALIYPDLDLVPTTDNHDGSNQQPCHFLPIIPTVLLNGSEGMAMGFSTNILPHSLDDIIKATLNVLNLTLPKLLPKYDCISGSYPIVLDKANQKYEFEGDVKIVNEQTVIITNLPPGRALEKQLEELYELEDKGVIKSVDDRSKTTIEIVVKFPRNFCAGWDRERAISFFKLYTRDTQRIVTVDWDGKTIRQFNSAEELVIEFVEKRFEWYIKRYEKFLATNNEELAYWYLFRECFNTNLPSKLKGFKTKADLVAEIDNVNKHHKCGADAEQIQRIAGLATYRWVKDAVTGILDTITELEADKAYNEGLLADHDLIWDIYKQEVKALKKVKYLTGRESV